MGVISDFLSVRDHPRSRGVYLRMKRQLGPESGSSPLARGLLASHPRRRRPTGIIPARAGFTPSASATVGSVEDHPRSRGVYTPAYNAAAVHSGSSPLARGLRPLPRGVSVPVGIIPARAGFTGAVAVLMVVVPDHPRSRGVYSPLGASSTVRAGSSPLARGLLDKVVDGLLSVRIIPARAGFTWTYDYIRPPLRDHPRSRGVYPAPVPPWTSGADHPRSRGVYDRSASSSGSHGGSSPLARGLPKTVARIYRIMGIIPARAGFTPLPLPVSANARDHPRSRGVYRVPGKHPLNPTGSSPLARGLHSLDIDDLDL